MHSRIDKVCIKTVEIKMNANRCKRYRLRKQDKIDKQIQELTMENEYLKNKYSRYKRKYKIVKKDLDNIKHEYRLYKLYHTHCQHTRMTDEEEIISEEE